MNEALDEKQSLELIQQMIKNTRVQLRKDSFYYLVWGWAVFIAAGSQFVLLTFELYQYHWWGWPFMMGTAGVAVGIYGARQSKASRVTTHLDTAMKYLWGGFVIMLFIVLGSMYKIGPEVAYPIIILLYGLGTFISGGLLKFKPLIFGGLSAFVLGGLAFYFPVKTQLLLLTASIAASYIIPGHLLRSREIKSETTA